MIYSSQSKTLGLAEKWAESLFAEKQSNAGFARKHLNPESALGKQPIEDRKHPMLVVLGLEGSLASPTETLSKAKAMKTKDNFKTDRNMGKILSV